MLHTKYQGSKPYGFRRCFCPIEAYVKQVTPGVGHFWPQGYNWTKFRRGSLGDASYPISSSRPCGFRQEDLFMFIMHISLYKTCDPGEGLFSPPGHNLNKVGIGPLDDAIIPNIKALGYMVEDFFMFFP